MCPAIVIALCATSSTSISSIRRTVAAARVVVPTLIVVVGIAIIAVPVSVGARLVVRIQLLKMVSRLLLRL